MITIRIHQPREKDLDHLLVVLISEIKSIKIMCYITKKIESHKSSYLRNKTTVQYNKIMYICAL